jgi:hypothetical protein
MEAFKKLWARLLIKTTEEWVFNCDSGCFYDVCQRQVISEGRWQAIYQPHKTMLDYSDMVATLLIKRLDASGKPEKLKASEFAKLKTEAIEPVNRLLLESYNELLRRSGNKWTHAIDGTFEALVQVRRGPELDPSGTVKFTFAIRGAVDGCCGDSWTPDKVYTLFRPGRAIEPMDDEWVASKCTKDAELANTA